ncbi:N-acetyltransferase [Paenibacillus xerothermodurans]|uniref:N-acetyltransferase n=2 Tax=Paenibacillus xerothermodurans TaxID=1977292 RepID=A0A2W1P364_PAEXE|nr:N-acetyltransferase [Paenibacillus xerothermodurans]
MRQYQIVERAPTPAEHKKLWEAVGWGPIDTRMTQASLSNHIYAVVAVCEGDVVGMGRIVGDGVMYFYIQEVAVLPQHQGRGLGKTIIEHLLAYIQKRRHHNGVAFAGLYATRGNVRLYERYGFKDHSPFMTGMYRRFE